MSPSPSVPEVIRNALARLSDDLKKFEQTTHGTMEPYCMDGVARALVACYENPSAYTVSTLSQVIDGLLDRHIAAGEVSS